MKKETTLDDVLEAVNTGFNTVQKQLGAMQENIADHDRRFDGLEVRLNGVEGRLNGLEGRFDGLERRLDRTDGKVNALINVLEKKSVITGTDKDQVLL